MKFADATNTNRKSGGAKWRDLLFFHPLTAIEGGQSTLAFVEVDGQIQLPCSR
jgi:hypothetical protein